MNKIYHIPLRVLNLKFVAMTFFAFFSVCPAKLDPAKVLHLQLILLLISLART